MSLESLSHRGASVATAYVPTASASPIGSVTQATRSAGFTLASVERSLPAYVISTPVVISSGVLFGLNCKFIRDYVSHWIRHPDPGSAFDRASRLVRWLPDSALLRLMLLMKYDGLIFSRAGEVVAHVFFQKHGSALHMFSVAVSQAFHGQGLAEQSLLRFLEHAQRQPEIDSVRLGAGRHPAVARICERMKARATELKLSVGEKGWIKFREKARTPTNK